MEGANQVVDVAVQLIPPWAGQLRCCSCDAHAHNREEEATQDHETGQQPGEHRGEEEEELEVAQADNLGSDLVNQPAHTLLGSPVSHHCDDDDRRTTVGWGATLLQRESKTEHLAKGSRRMEGTTGQGKRWGVGRRKSSTTDTRWRGGGPCQTHRGAEGVEEENGGGGEKI